MGLCFFCLFLGSSLLFVLFNSDVLDCFILLYLILLTLRFLFSNEGQKGDGSGREGGGEELGGVRGKGNHNQNILCGKKIYLQ